MLFMNYSYLCDSTHLQNQLNLTHTHTRIDSLSAPASTPLRGTGDAFWATSNQKEVFTRKAVRLLFEIAARPIPFIINSLQVVYEH